MSDDGKSKLSSTFGMYITLLGFSWGMSDIWRFPFLAYRNGGGAFIIPFIITILLCGIPLYFLEFGIGKFSGKGPYKVWDVAPLFRGTGITIFMAYSTYVFGSTIFRGWIFQFCFYSFQNPLPWTTCDNTWNQPTCRESGFKRLTSGSSSDAATLGNANVTMTTNQTFPQPNGTLYTTNTNNTFGSISGLTAEEEFWRYNILGLSSGLTDIYPIHWKYVIFTFVWRAVVTFIVIFGIRAIEKVMYVSATLPVLASIAVLIRSLMLPGATDGLYHFFYPDLAKLADIKIWIEAFVMAFYTLAFGWGCIILLGSHTKFKDSSVRAAIICPILDAAMAIFQGMVCFSVLGNMAAAHGVDVKDVIEANLSTGIIALVSAMSALPMPQLWSLLFFVSFILSSLDTQLVPFEMMVEILGELFPKLFSKYRIQMIIGLSLCIFVLGLPTCTGAGAYIFLLMDWYAGAWSGPVAALVEVAVVGWIYGLDRWSDDIKIMTGKSLPLFMHVGIAFITPLFVAAIFVVSIIEYTPPSYGNYTYPTWARLLGWFLVAVIISPICLVAISRVYSDRGPLKQRLKRLIKPSEQWGPAEEESMSEYGKTIIKYKSRPYKDLLMYNVTRRHRNNTFNVHTSQEMNGLV